MMLCFKACCHGITADVFERASFRDENHLCVHGCNLRSRRSRQGPVIEADGMLKMFHCPYDGCSQVYVALSSYQVSITNTTVVLLGLNGQLKTRLKNTPYDWNLMYSKECTLIDTKGYFVCYYIVAFLMLTGI